MSGLVVLLWLLAVLGTKPGLLVRLFHCDHLQAAVSGPGATGDHLSFMVLTDAVAGGRIFLVVTAGTDVSVTAGIDTGMNLHGQKRCS